jgi:hypothetical protein
MELRADAVLAFPIDRVFSAYRDRLEDLVAYLPNIRAIKVLERREREGAVELVNEWVGGGDIPKVARAFVSESMLSWTDYATWHADARACDWRTIVRAFPDAVESAGRNVFEPVGEGKTRLVIRGSLVVDAAKVPGVPRLLSRTVGEAVEKLLVEKISTNAVEVARGVERLLST